MICLLVKIHVYALAFSAIVVFGGEDDSEYNFTAHLILNTVYVYT